MPLHFVVTENFIMQSTIAQEWLPLPPRSRAHWLLTILDPKVSSPHSPCTTSRRETRTANHGAQPAIARFSTTRTKAIDLPPSVRLRATYVSGRTPTESGRAGQTRCPPIGQVSPDTRCYELCRLEPFRSSRLRPCDQRWNALASRLESHRYRAPHRCLWTNVFTPSPTARCSCPNELVAS